MAVHRIHKGLDLPITGMPAATIETKSVSRVAVLANDVIGLKPRMRVQEGEEVRRGSPLFEHRKRPGLVFTSPAAGRVLAVHRGERRVLHSVVIELSEAEQRGEGEQINLTSFADRPVRELQRDDVRALLLESGLWSSLRERPFSTVPGPQSGAPGAIFVNAADSNPGAPDLDQIVQGKEKALSDGLLALSTLTEGPLFLVRAMGSKINPGAAKDVTRVEEFGGKHPYGLVGTHIHHLYPVNRARRVWHLDVQDAIAIGTLVATGKIDVHRVISLSGPQVKNPRMLRTRIGASTEDLVSGELHGGENRIVSGSALCGRKAHGEEFGYLGRYAQQITVLREGRERELFGWLGPGTDKFSVINTFVSKLIPGKRFDFTTSTQGSHRAMVPIGMHEKVMPLDIMPTFLLRALAMQDLERAEALGCLELDEEDLALCTFVDTGKTDYGSLLRTALSTIEEEG